MSRGGARGRRGRARHRGRPRQAGARPWFPVGPDLEVVDAAERSTDLVLDAALFAERVDFEPVRGVRQLERRALFTPRASEGCEKGDGHCRRGAGPHPEGTADLTPISTASPGEEGERRRRPRGVGGAAPGAHQDDRVALTEVRHVEDDAIACLECVDRHEHAGCDRHIEDRARAPNQVSVHPPLSHTRTGACASITCGRNGWSLPAGITAGRPHGSRPSSAEER